MPSSGARHNARTLLPVCIFLPLLVVLAACEQPSPVQEGKPKPTNSTGVANYKPPKPPEAPNVSATISRVKLNWRDRQQTFDLNLTNEGDKVELVHAIVYARNESVNPPRRAISPPTASDWFGLAETKEGQLTPTDIERCWKAAGFLTARGGRLRRTWDVKVEPGATLVEAAAHDLDDVSPHPAWKGKKLANVGYTEYQVWLFTAEGYCYFDATVPVDKTGPIGIPPPDTKPQPTKKGVDPKKGPDKTVTDTRPKDAKPLSPTEVEAANELKLANAFLDMGKVTEAKNKLNLIVSKYPDTEAARTARRLLKNLF
jgi:hypothetical protein